MLTCDRQFEIAVVQQFPPQVPRVHLKIAPPESSLDGDLPY